MVHTPKFYTDGRLNKSQEFNKVKIYKWTQIRYNKSTKIGAMTQKLCEGTKRPNITTSNGRTDAFYGMGQWSSMNTELY